MPRQSVADLLGEVDQTPAVLLPRPAPAESASAAAAEKPEPRRPAPQRVARGPRDTGSGLGQKLLDMLLDVDSSCFALHSVHGAIESDCCRSHRLTAQLAVADTACVRQMNPARFRVVVIATLFIGWVALLLWLWAIEDEREGDSAVVADD